MGGGGGAITCAIIFFSIQTQELNSRKHLLDFFFPWIPLQDFFGNFEIPYCPVETTRELKGSLLLQFAVAF